MLRARYTWLTCQSYTAATIRLCSTADIDPLAILSAGHEPPHARQLNVLLGKLLEERRRFLEKLHVYRSERRREKHAGRRQPDKARLRALYAPDYWQPSSLRLLPWRVWSTEARSYRHGFIDAHGEWAIQPKYDRALAFTEDLAPVQFGGKWGYVDPQGQWVIEPAYTEAWFFLRGEALVKGDIDRAKDMVFGQTVWPVPANHLVIDRDGHYLRKWLEP